jgi:catechol 2,3-dioxygenase-like lactoylglutathione lyase family enzyme
MIGTGLAYVGIVVRDVEAVAAILERDFQLPRSYHLNGSTGRQTPVFAVGRTQAALFETGDPFVGGAEKTGVHHIAVSVDDLEDAVRDAYQQQLPALSSQPQAGLGTARRVLLDPKSTGGVITYLSEPLTADAAEGGPVERIDHIGVASQDNRAAVEVFSRRLGWPVESTQTDAQFSTVAESFTSDKYGVAYHTQQPELLGGLRVAFITVGDCDLEFLQELDQGSSGEVQRGRPGDTQQDRSVISRYIASRGPGLHHIGLKVRDIDGLLGALHRTGHTLIDKVGRPGSRQGKIGFIHPASLGGWLVHLVQRDSHGPHRAI